jgi:hypothetical protein
LGSDQLELVEVATIEEEIRIRSHNVLRYGNGMSSCERSPAHAEWGLKSYRSQSHPVRVSFRRNTTEMRQATLRAQNCTRQP